MKIPKTDLEWLISRLPKEDELSVKESQAAEIVSLIKARDRESLPATIGLFGSWGTGKTTVLAYVADVLRQEPEKYTPVYFNAWKYAGFMEVVPAAIYQVASALPPKSGGSSLEGIAKVMLGLGRDHAQTIGEWTKAMVGVNLIDVGKQLKDTKDRFAKARDPLAEVLKKYFTQIDDAQTEIARMLEKHEPTVVLLIDELDRCDPGEAFEVIKKLRVFFSMRNTPIIFVMAINPDPIGQAIRHQFGLSGEYGDFDARRIIEKFVDDFVEMSASHSIWPFVSSMFHDAQLDPDEATFAGRIDAELKIGPFMEDTVRNCSFRHSIRADNPVYLNRRILTKCLRRATSRMREDRHRLWLAWHLEIAGQANAPLRQEMASLASLLSRATSAAVRRTIHTLASRGVNFGKSLRLDRPVEVTSDIGNSAYSIYRFNFRSTLQSTQPDSNSRIIPEVRDRWLNDHRVMDFILNAMMPSLHGLEFDRQPVNGDIVNDDSASGKAFQEAFSPKRVEWMLTNY